MHGARKAFSACIRPTDVTFTSLFKLLTLVVNASGLSHETGTIFAPASSLFFSHSLLTHVHSSFFFRFTYIRLLCRYICTCIYMCLPSAIQSRSFSFDIIEMDVCRVYENVQSTAFWGLYTSEYVRTRTRTYSLSATDGKNLSASPTHRGGGSICI